MPFFNSNSKLEILNQVKETPFTLEREIQHLMGSEFEYAAWSGIR